MAFGTKQIRVVSIIVIVITVIVMVIITIGMVIAIVIIVSAVPQGIGADGRAAAVLYPASLVLWALHAVMSSTDSRFSPSVRPITFYSVIKARKVIMKVKPSHQAPHWKRVRKSLRAAAYLAAPRPREGGASQPHFDTFEELTSSQGVLYLKTSAATIKHLLQPFQKLEKGYGRNLHGFSADIENIKKRLQEVIVFLDRENEIPTREEIREFLRQENRRSNIIAQEIIALRSSAPPSLSGGAFLEIIVSGRS